MVGAVLTLPQLGEGIFIWGWKSGRWKQRATSFGHKFGATGLQAGLAAGTGLQTGRPVARQRISPPPPILLFGPVPDWSGLPPDGSAWSPA
jgi:hypothetical protein